MAHNRNLGRLLYTPEATGFMESDGVLVHAEGRALVINPFQERHHHPSADTFSPELWRHVYKVQHERRRVLAEWVHIRLMTEKEAHGNAFQNCVEGQRPLLLRPRVHETALLFRQLVHEFGERTLLCGRLDTNLNLHGAVTNKNGVHGINLGPLTSLKSLPTTTTEVNCLSRLDTVQS